MLKTNCREGDSEEMAFLRVCSWPSFLLNFLSGVKSTSKELIGSAWRAHVRPGVCQLTKEEQGVCFFHHGTRWDSLWLVIKEILSLWFGVRTENFVALLRRGVRSWVPRIDLCRREVTFGEWQWVIICLNRWWLQLQLLNYMCVQPTWGRPT